ncbi:hypothetical protein [Sphingomonas solaris]|uniref:Uncharacterized protein n=1 Tax=Alterirhizorhabdus solaris TaxID=2529389 RepID=A0A558QXP7_9SPHN|nr:hypothetical protein [Sphingomonas solaris]TVV71859.1 hypothetical protein FOY91_15840 [Sphingomonas solaris]
MPEPLPFGDRLATLAAVVGFGLLIFERLWWSSDMAFLLALALLFAAAAHFALATTRMRRDDG